MNKNNKDRAQIDEPQINNWNAEFNKLDGKIRKGGGPKSDYRIVMAALRQPRNKKKLNLK